MSVFITLVADADLPVTTAAGVPETVIGEAQFDGVITDVSIIAEAAMTGATATARTMTVYNRGQSGSGTTVVASLAFVTGTDLVANDEKALTLTATTADRNFVAGDTFECVETVASTGTIRPEARLVIRGTHR